MSARTDAADWRFERAAVIGAGAMGTGLAAFLGSVMPVVLVCRNPARAMQVFEHGVRTFGKIEAAARPVVVGAVEDLPKVGGADAIFVATKTGAIPRISSQLRPLLPDLASSSRGVFVVSYQNGIETGRQLMESLGHERVLRMVLALGAIMDRDTGDVRITLDAPPHAIGTVHPEFEGPCARVAEALTRGGLRTAYDGRIEQRVWEKGIVNAAMNPVAALVNSSVGEVLDSPASEIAGRLLAEGITVARAEGIALPTEFALNAWSLFEHAGGHVPSMVDDIRAGRETEIGQLNRQIIEHAARVGVPVPTHEVIDALIETFDWKVYQTQQSRN